MGYYSDNYQDTIKDVLAELDQALCAVDHETVEKFVQAVLEAEQVYFVGVGRVLLSLQAICKRLAHLGIQTHYVGEITEPAITEKDLLVVGSGSGGSLFPLGIAKKAHTIGAKIVHIGSNPNSEMKNLCEFMVRIPVRTKNYLNDEIDSVQPMTTLFEQSLLIFGDAVAKMIIDERNIDMKSLWKYHANLE
ncbi:MAG: 6-phospho-3-hexuloisomerase [Blautia sp.]|jgi:6-phospho-3-hexuloisomerase